MKRKKYLLLFIIICIFSLNGCRSKINPVRQDLENYINAINNLSTKEEEALNDYRSIIGDNYKNDDVCYMVLKKLVIPKYSDFLNELNTLKPTYDEIIDIHNIYISSCTKQLTSFNKFKDALKNKNNTEFKEANKIFYEARKELKLFKKKLKKLTSKYKIQINNT